MVIGDVGTIVLNNIFFRVLPYEGILFFDREKRTQTVQMRQKHILFAFRLLAVRAQCTHSVCERERQQVKLEKDSEITKDTHTQTYTQFQLTTHCRLISYMRSDLNRLFQFYFVCCF